MELNAVFPKGSILEAPALPNDKVRLLGASALRINLKKGEEEAKLNAALELCFELKNNCPV